MYIYSCQSVTEHFPNISDLNCDRINYLSDMKTDNELFEYQQALLTVFNDNSSEEEKRNPCIS